MTHFLDNVDLRYNALSFIFLQIRELSWLQWHPFSVSSSPLDGKYHLCVLIKAMGEWTEKLKGTVLNSSRADLHLQPRTKITASIDGPYGHELPYHLMYATKQSISLEFTRYQAFKFYIIFYFKN